MSKSRIGVTLFGAALLFSASAFAGNGNKGSLKLSETVTVEGTTLKPGDYQVEWNGNGPDVQATILKGGRTVATFPAHVTEQAAAAETDGYGYRRSDQPNGGNTLTAIYFGGKHYALQVESAAASQQNQSNSAPAK